MTTKPARRNHLLSALVGCLLASALVAPEAAAQTVELTDACVVSVLNRSTRVGADGSWALPNVPSEIGPVRARATCVENGVTRTGVSDLVTVPSNGIVRVAEIRFDEVPASARRLDLTAPVTELTSVGETAQVQVEARLTDGSSVNVTSGDLGTLYVSSNPALISVDADGLVTAHASGNVILTVSFEGVVAFLRLSSVVSGDSDGDGLPDDFELAAGLDPNDPADALEDEDGDGLSNLDEFQRGLDLFDPDSDDDGLRDGLEVNTVGTDPALFDTDGDGLSDGLEVATGSDPLNRASFDLAAAVVSIRIEPAEFVLIFNTVEGEASRQLRVIAELIDDNELDITSSFYGTAFESSDLLVASFGLANGRVFAGADGSAVLTAANSGHSAQSNVVVQSFEPQSLATLVLPGFANGVDVRRLEVGTPEAAFVACGREGLQVVDITDLAAPALAAGLDLPGNANDVRVAGDLVFVAAGAGGLQVVDASSPFAPVVVGSAPTPGPATDLVVEKGLAYVADEAGLRIFDVSVPAAPFLLGGVEVPGRSRGVDVEDGLAVVASSRAGLFVVDVSDPAAPAVIGSTPTQPNLVSAAAAVAVRGRRAWVADGSDRDPNNLVAVDFSVLSSPVVVGASARAGLMDVALERNFALGADYLFVNGAPVFEISEDAPDLRAQVRFPGDVNGTGISVLNGVVFVTATAGSAGVDNGVIGSSRLQIGRYAIFGDDFGIPPRVEILAPADGESLVARLPYTVEVDAVDDLVVQSVDFLIDGEVVFRDFGAPYRFETLAPADAGELTIGAVAVDSGGNSAAAEPVTVTVEANERPVVRLLSPADGASFVGGVRIPVVIDASDDIELGRVELSVGGAVEASFAAPPFETVVTLPEETAPVLFEARAEDSAGLEDTAAATVQVSADGAPFIAWLEPAEDGEVAEGSGLRAVLAASDDLGVASVQLEVNGVVVGERTEPPWEFDVPVPPGADNLSLTAVATDVRGQLSGTETIQLTVTSQPPLVRISSPRAGASVRAGDVVSVRAVVADDVGVDEVLILIDNEVAATFSEGPYEVDHTVPADRSFLRLDAAAVDTLGQGALATRFVPIVGNLPPVVELVSPEPGSTVVAGSTVLLAADVTDDSAVESVTFRVDGQDVETRTAPPWQASYQVPAVEEINVEIVATDDEGATSTFLAVFPVAVNQPPELTLVSPPEGAELVAGGLVLVLAEASDDSAVEEVRFRVPDYDGEGDDLEVSLNFEPYAFSLEVPADAESLTLIVTAVDDQDAETEVVRTFAVVAGSPTTVVGRLTDGAGTPLADAVVLLLASLEGEYLGTAFTDGAGSFTLAGVPADLGSLQALAAFDASGPGGLAGEIHLRGESSSTPPAPGGVTDLGTLVLTPPMRFRRADLCDDTFVAGGAPPFGVPCRESEGLELGVDLVDVEVEMTADEVVFRFYFLEDIEPELFSGFIAFDLDGDPGTGGRSTVDELSPHAETGLGTDLEVRVFRGRLEDRDRLESGGVGAGIAFSFEEMTLVLPREKLGERFRFAAAFYQFPSNDGGGQHLRSDAGPALKADVFVDRFLAIDVGPNGGAWTLPDDSDRDRDGASDRQEAGAGTDPFDEDTDGDLLLDGFELEFSFDPLDDAFEDSSDPDDDNLETLVEQSLGTDPLNADTDGDGLSDFDEPELDGEVGGGDFGIRLKGFIGSPSALGTSPARFDSDGDGLDDGTEVQVLGSDPTEADTDEDGLDDGEEELRGLSFDGFDTDSGGASDGAEALVDGTNPSLGADDVEPVFLGGSGFLPAAVAVDSGGAAHVGWIRSGRLRYAMVSPSGAVRIADTELSATASAGRPAVALDTQDRLHVAWTAPAGSRRTIRHLLLDPALDDQDGSPASAAAIVVSPSQDIGSGGTFSSRDPALTLDGAGRVHAVWVDPFDGDEIHYSRLSAAGSVELRDLVLFLGGDSVRDLGARGHGDAVQLLWTQEAPFFGRSQPVFALLGAATAAVEIDVTPLLPVDDESEIQGLAIAGGSGAESTVVFHHREIERGTGAFCGAIRLLRLDPSVDDRDGSPADPDSLARSSRTLQRCLATRETYDPTAGLSAGGELTVAWLDEDFISTTARMSRFAADGTRLQGAVAISRFRGLVEEIPIAVGAGDSHVFLVWTSTSGQLRIRVVTP